MRNGRFAVFCIGLALCAAWVGARDASAQTTHLGQHPLDHVMLRMERGVHGGCIWSGGSEFFRVSPLGDNVEALPFRVPDGMLLVVTDVDWWVEVDGAPREGEAVTFDLTLERPSFTPRNAGPRVFRDVATEDAAGRAGRSVSTTAGILLAPDARICPYALRGGSILVNTGDPVLEANLRGYLIASESPAPYAALAVEAEAPADRPDWDLEPDTRVPGAEGDDPDGTEFGWDVREGNEPAGGGNAGNGGGGGSAGGGSGGFGWDVRDPKP